MPPLKVASNFQNMYISISAVTVLERMQDVLKKVKRMDAAMLSSIIAGEQVDVRTLILLENSMRQSWSLKNLI
jgi:hypothetical protein